MDGTLKEAQKHDLAIAIRLGWVRYTELFGEPPHGTEKQIKAMLELVHLEGLIRGIQNRAINLHYASGQGKCHHERLTEEGICRTCGEDCRGIL